MSHLKRLAATKHFPIERKVKKFTISPRAGPHPKYRCIPLQIIIREILKYVKGGKEAKRIIKAGEVKVDSVVRKDHKYPVGLMDVVEIKKTNEYFRVVPKKGKLIVTKIKKENAKYKLCQIKNKTTIKNGNLQLNLHDGRNIITNIKNPKKSSEDIYRVGDTLIISLPEQKIKNHISMKEGNLAMITDGKHAGSVGKITKIIILKKIKANRVRIKGKEEEIKTLKEYAFVIGKNKPEIMLP